MRLAFAPLLLVLSFSSSLAFVHTSHGAGNTRALRVITKAPRFGSVPIMNQDEIAELEARLAALKKKEEEEKAEKAAAEAAMVSAAEVAARAAEAPPARPSGTAPSELGPEGFDLSTLSARKRSLPSGDASGGALSEAWKESEGSQGEGGGIVPIIGGVVAAVALFAFAQVPVGGNAGLAPSAPPLPTAEQIRAKYAEVGALEADRPRLCSG